MSKVKLELEQADLDLIISYFEELKSRYSLSNSNAFAKLDELLTHLKQSILMSDKRYLKLMGIKK